MSATINIGVVPVGIEKLRWGITPVQQKVIPRYYNGTEHPAGTLEGWGPESKLQSDGTTQNLASSPDDLRYIAITTFPVSADLSEWQDATTGRDPAVLQPIVRNLTIAGYPDFQADHYHGSSSYLNVFPQQQNVVTNFTTLYGGYRGYGGGGIVENVCFFYIPGICCHISRPNSSLERKTLPHDRLKWNVSRCSFRRAFAGCNMDAVDSMISDCEAEMIRDYGFRLGGSVMFRDLHPYGVGHTGAADSVASGVWLAGQSNQGGPIYPENCPIGLYISAKYNQVKEVFSHTCVTNNIKIIDTNNFITIFELSNCSSANILLTAGANYLAAGAIEVKGATKGIHLASGSAGEFVTLHGIDIIGSYAMRHAPEQAFATNGTAIDVDVTINRCNWTAIRAFDMTNGIDFSGGGIGEGNFIWFTTAGGLGVTNKILWPTGQTWSTTFVDNATNRKNQIYLNGERQYLQ